MSIFERTKYITGLRAYSALGVLLIHSGGGGLRELSSFTNKIVDFGKYGVVSFFVISAFTISMSVDRMEQFNLKEYFFKRFLRIAPLFYIVTLFCFFFTGGNEYFNNLFGVQSNLYSLILHLTFLNLFDVRHINNIIGVEGTVPIEFAYYLFIPYILILFKKNKKIIYPIVIAAFIFSFYSFQFFSRFYNKTNLFISHNLSLEKYLFTFIIGIAGYLLWRERKEFSFGSSLALLFHFILLASMIKWEIQYPEIYFALWVVGLVFICSGKSWLAKVVFENPVIEYIGKISYSIYLVHFPIINALPQFKSQVLNLIVPLGISIVIGSLTYQFIELQFIRIAHKKSK